MNGSRVLVTRKGGSRDEAWAQLRLGHMAATRGREGMVYLPPINWPKSESRSIGRGFKVEGGFGTEAAQPATRRKKHSACGVLCVGLGRRARRGQQFSTVETPKTQCSPVQRSSGKGELGHCSEGRLGGNNTDAPITPASPSHHSDQPIREPCRCSTHQHVPRASRHTHAKPLPPAYTTRSAPSRSKGSRRPST